MDARVEPIITEANENRARYESFCRSLTNEELHSSIPDTHWSVQDYIAHLATIDIYVAEWFEHTADGTRLHFTNDDGSPFNIDTWNESRVVERKQASLDDLFDEAATYLERLWNAVSRFSPQALDAHFNFRGTDISMLRYLQLWTAHDPAHSVDMLKGLPPERRDATMDAWLKKYRM
jgi:hypothetical protein